jgi:hypothetical protein
VAGCARDPYAGFDHPRVVHLAADGRLIVTDLGTGRDDGRVVAIDADGKRTTLLDKLPSTRGSRQKYADLSGPSAPTWPRTAPPARSSATPTSGPGTTRCAARTG